MISNPAAQTQHYSQPCHPREGGGPVHNMCAALLRSYWIPDVSACLAAGLGDDDRGVNSDQDHPRFSNSAERTEQTSWKINNLSFCLSTDGGGDLGKSQRTNYWSFSKNRQNELSDHRFRKMQKSMKNPCYSLAQPAITTPTINLAGATALCTGFISERRKSCPSTKPCLSHGRI